MRTSTATALARGEFSLCCLSSEFTRRILHSILEYLSREDAERAVKELDGKDLRGNSVRVALDTTEVRQLRLMITSVPSYVYTQRPAATEGYRREERREYRDDRYARDDRYGRGGDDRYNRDERYARGDDRYARDERYPREDRYKDDRSRREERAPYTRERSRSPTRRADYDDRRPRSPPAPRRDDERRPAGYDDRRGAYDYRREPDPYLDRRRDDRRREERDYDRPPRANGDNGWAR